MATQTPVTYDSVAKVHRPMTNTETVPVSTIPVSSAVGNRVQALTDGVYIGGRGLRDAPYVFYVNGSTGSDSNSGITKAAPFATLGAALNAASALFPAGQFAGDVLIALQAGQTFTMPNNMAVYDGHLSFAFYGDPTFGDWNSPAIGSGANPSVIATLQRPVILPQASVVSAQNTMTGVLRYGGDITLNGVRVDLPAAPSAPAMVNYSTNCDFIRNQNRSRPGVVSLYGSIVNMTDPNAFWGFMGVQARSTNTTLSQFASQFRINGLTMSPANNPTAAQLLARTYFVKFFADWAGNNQQSLSLQTSTANSSTGSGLLNLTWSDTGSLTVSAGVVNQASFPIAFDVDYGLRNYVFGMTRDQQQRPLNLISSRQI